ncbi:MAG: hypothetical protein D6736_17085 [Nitrospinota bacterium]|nr:MAG: hypothetical protein D6736_17085 [Nitrospinota bacterium]
MTWLDLTNPDIETRRVILGELIAEINGAPRSTGMSPFWQEEELMFLQTWAIVAGVKSQGLTL